MRCVYRLGLLTGLVALAAPACGSGTSADGGGVSDEGVFPDTGNSNSESGASVSSNGASSADGVLDVMGGTTDPTATDEGGGECDESQLPNPDGQLTGTVYSPSLEIPISGALVYLTSEAVEPVPDGVYCAECVEIPCDAYHVLTEPDGSFVLPSISGPGQQLVVQKGQFLHVTPLDVQPGSTPVAVTDSNLPGQWNPAAGEWIPRIAVFDAHPDYIYHVLAKFGLGQVSASGELINGTENFTLIQSSLSGGQVLDDLAQMNQYHIMFVPCATHQGIGSSPLSELRKVNIRDYVAAGGKWYVTDHANEYLYETFPNYQTLHHQDTFPDLQPAYDVVGSVVDPNLLAWLQALPPNLQDIGQGFSTLAALPAITLVLNYSGIDAIYDVFVQDEEGMDVNVGHHTWIEGPCTSCDDSTSIRPMGISAEYGCGRMMYSTYESSSTTHTGLSPQELALLYIILEIGVCFGDPPPPPPPID
jgi:hypothetical protein